MTGPRVRDLLERKGDPLQLEALTGDLGLDRLIPSPEASGPGLVLAGYTKRFAAHRIHILGETEITYLDSLTPAERRKSLETFFQFDIPCVVIAKAQEAPAELLELARAKGVPVIRTRLKTDWNRKELGKPHVKINTIGFFYESPDLGAFLWALAREHQAMRGRLSAPRDRASGAANGGRTGRLIGESVELTAVPLQLLALGFHDARRRVLHEALVREHAFGARDLLLQALDLGCRVPVAGAAVRPHD